MIVTNGVGNGYVSAAYRSLAGAISTHSLQDLQAE